MLNDQQEAEKEKISEYLKNLGNSDEQVALFHKGMEKSIKRS